MSKFDDIQTFLDTLYEGNEKAQTIIENAGFTPNQLQLIDILIVTALKAYDASKEGLVFSPR